MVNNLHLVHFILFFLSILVHYVCADCPYLLRSWLRSECSISLIWLSSLAGVEVLGGAGGRAAASA